MMHSKFIKENLETYGDSFGDMEVFSILIGKKATMSILEYGINTLSELFTLSNKELLGIENVSKSTINKINAMKHLFQKGISPVHNNNSIGNPDSLYNINKDMKNFDREVLRIICLNSKNQVIRKKDIFKGGITSTTVDIRILMKDVIQSGAATFAIAHNHPSGDPTPSKEDINLTKRVNESGKILGVNLIDHIIIGRDYVSLKEKGYI